ncbi:hypothetical protein RRF57_006735 [Xylaria bambusicola]|uniref:Uncharacterized protein n=1 Tax=Xylaria bambusicola TaxID=326684 RepID=A0AAN7UEV7_9PEZI
MARSAHFVQTIPRQRVRLPEIRPYEYEQVPSDDSSEEGESSGEESREDEPDAAARDNRTRRQIVAADPVAARRKTDRHERRMRAARRARASRYDGALARYNRNQALMRQGRAPIQFVDIHDENRKDFLLLQHCRFGDLETLVAR